MPVTCSNCCCTLLVPVASDHASGYACWLSAIACAKSALTVIGVCGCAVVSFVVSVGVVVFVVVTVFDALGLDTLTLDELLELRAAPAPLELVPLELVPLELVDALAEPLDVDVLDLDELVDGDRLALAPAVAVVLPLLTIYDPHLFYFVYHCWESN